MEYEFPSITLTGINYRVFFLFFFNVHFSIWHAKICFKHNNINRNLRKPEKKKMCACLISVH